MIIIIEVMEPQKDYYAQSTEKLNDEDMKVSEKCLQFKPAKFNSFNSKESNFLGCFAFKKSNLLKKKEKKYKVAQVLTYKVGELDHTEKQATELRIYN